MTAQNDPKSYESKALERHKAWLVKVQKRPGLWDQTTRATQDRINGLIPEKVHEIVTSTVKGITKGLMSGSGWTSSRPLTFGSLEERESEVRERIKIYKRTASVEGGVAGAGGFVMAAADFPALMAIKIKLLFEICALYGHDSRDPAERLYMLRIFQLAFSSARHRPEALAALEAANPDREEATAPDFATFDWRKFQLEYRDYIDLVKLAQMVPVIGAPVGALANWHLTKHLANTAMEAYRLRWFQQKPTAP